MAVNLNNNKKKNRDQKNNIILGSIIGLALLSLFVFLSNPGLLIPPNDDNGNEADATPIEEENNNEPVEEQVVVEEIQPVIEDNSIVTPEDTEGNNSADNGNSNEINSNDNNNIVTPEIPETNTNNNSGNGGNNNNDDDNNHGGDCDLCGNHKPVAEDIVTNTNEDTTITIDISSYVTDSDNDAITLAIMSDPAHGEVTLNEDGTALYVPDPDYFGPDSFTYRGSDPSQHGNTATVSISVNPVFTTHMDGTTFSYGISLFGGRPVIVEHVGSESSLIGDEIDTIILMLGKEGIPTGAAEVGVFNEDLSVKKLFGTIDVSSIDSSYLEYTFTLDDSELYTIEAGDRIGIKFTGGSESENVMVGVDNDPDGPFDGTSSFKSFYEEEWIDVPNGDLWMQLIDSR